MPNSDTALHLLHLNSMYSILSGIIVRCPNGPLLRVNILFTLAMTYVHVQSSGHPQLSMDTNSTHTDLISIRGRDFVKKNLINLL